MTFQAVLISNKISSNKKEAQDLFESQRFGEKTGEKIFYMLSEAYYLVEQKKMEIVDGKYEKISKDNLLKKFLKIDKKFKIKYLAFKDLRKKGYIVKSALKFGADFRVYEKNKNMNGHSKWLLYATSENEKLTWQEFSVKNRVAHSTKKNLLIAVVDEENDVTYYEVKWEKIN